MKNEPTVKTNRTGNQEGGQERIARYAKVPTGEEHYQDDNVGLHSTTIKISGCLGGAKYS